MNLLLPDSGLLFWMAIIFLIVFALLAKFGFPMITGMVEKRTKMIDDALAAARQAESKLGSLAREQEKILETTRLEQSRMMQEAAAERENIISQAREQAMAEAGKVMAEAKARIGQEKEEALREIRREVTVLSLAIAEKIMRSNLADGKEQKDFAERMVDEAFSAKQVEK